MKRYQVIFELEEGSDGFWGAGPSLKEISNAIENTLYHDCWIYDKNSNFKIEVKQIED